MKKNIRELFIVPIHNIFPRSMKLYHVFLNEYSNIKISLNENMLLQILENLIKTWMYVYVNLLSSIIYKRNLLTYDLIKFWKILILSRKIKNEDVNNLFKKIRNMKFPSICVILGNR